MLDYAWIIPVIPAVSFVLILFFGKKMPRQGSEIGIVAVGTTFVLSCITAVAVDPAGQRRRGQARPRRAVSAFGKGFLPHGDEHDAVVKPVIHTVTWWQNGGIKFTVGTQIDGLAVMMLFVVTLISLLVHIYSTAYMHGDIRYTYFYAALSLFTASMLTLVVASNTLQLLVGWELVGLCSFMLIGHWWEEQANTNAAMKAFLTTRTGDIGLMLGVIVTFFAAGQDLQHRRHQQRRAPGQGRPHDLARRRELPAHRHHRQERPVPAPHLAARRHGRPDPGVRADPRRDHGRRRRLPRRPRLQRVLGGLLDLGTAASTRWRVVGGITILIGAALAFVQDDIKKVLAYSTISQLGYMVMGLGVGAWTGAVFHLFTHAFFKALLFLGAGSVSHSGSHHSFDMKKDMGGLRKYMPITFVTFMIGSLALAGVFPLAGFWSKDEILATAGQGGFEIFMIVGLVGAVLTAAYMTRCVYLTFFGEYRGHGAPARVAPLDHRPAHRARRLQHRRRPRERQRVRHRGVRQVRRARGRVPAGDRPRLRPHARRGLVLPRDHLASGSRASSGSTARSSRGSRASPIATARPRPGTRFLVNKYYLDHLYEGDDRRAASRARSPAPRTG